MRLTKPHKTVTAEMDMTPMIDVTFQLIAFFMFVLNFSEVDQDQRINLPSSELAKPADAPYELPLTIQLTGTNTVLFAGDEMTLDGLQVGPAARSRRSSRPIPRRKSRDVTVIIRADQNGQDGQGAGSHPNGQKAEFDNFALRGKHQRPARR